MYLLKTSEGTPKPATWPMWRGPLAYGQATADRTLLMRVILGAGAAPGRRGLVGGTYARSHGLTDCRGPAAPAARRRLGQAHRDDLPGHRYRRRRAGRAGPVRLRRGGEGLGAVGASQGRANGVRPAIRPLPRRGPGPGAVQGA